MRDHSKHIELSRDDAQHLMLDRLQETGTIESYSQRIERVPLGCAYGRILAQDVLAKTDIPNVLTCCLDSVALHWDDFEGLPEGELPDTSAWERGVDWQFANTGVAMPKGFDTAIVIENVEVSEDEQSIQIKVAPSKRFAGTRAAGSTIHAGDLMVSSGTMITPDIAARIASAGHSSASVLQKPRVSFIPTGDELVFPNLPFSNAAPERYAGYGHVFESNSAVVRGKVETWGGTFVPFDIVADEKAAIQLALESALKVSDIIVLNAGSSKGSDDWSVEVLEEMGEIICHQTNHGPGHHSSYALLKFGDKTIPVVGISGPAGGASFTLDFYLRPIMHALLGLDPYPKKIPCILGGSFGANKHAKDFEQKERSGEDRPPEATEPGSKFYSVRFMELSARNDGTLVATPIPGKAGSPATLHANALYLLPAAASDVFPVEGDLIEVELRFGYNL